MSDSKFTVFVVDDDAGVLKALTRLIRAAGYKAQPYDCPTTFLNEHDASIPGCVILDLSMPKLDGIQIQSALANREIRRPVIFVSGRSDVRQSVTAMKGGAIDFLTKPVDADELLAAIARAEAQDAQTRRAFDELSTINSKLTLLTPREREVMLLVAAGRLNKQIAGDLGTVEKTVKVHRGRMMNKMGVRTVADLVRLTERIGLRVSA